MEQALPLPSKIFWADTLWNLHALIMMGLGGWFINEYPVKLGTKKMYGPYKWWTLVSIGFVALNGIPLVPWVFYYFYGQ